jgi:hypothetical protein
MEVGKRYYFIAHAYHHFLGEVVEITGQRSAILNNVIRVQSCKRGWTEFFRNGILSKEDTVYTVWPDGHETGPCISITPWHHDIPRS